MVMWCGIWIRWLCLWYPVRGMIPRDSTGTRLGWNLSSYYVYYRLICMLIVVYSSSSSATVNERQDIWTDFKLIHDSFWSLSIFRSLINLCTFTPISILWCYLYSLPCHIGWPAAAGEDILFRLINIIVWLAIAPSKNHHHPTTRLSIDASRPPLDSWQGW